MLENSNKLIQKSNCEDIFVIDDKEIFDNNESQQGISSKINDIDRVYCFYNGIKFYDIPNMIKLEYNGILASSGAADIYAVIGYGENDNWQDIGTYKMQETSKDNFEVLTFRKGKGNINVAFVDNAGNWDNNLSNNYIFIIKSQNAN